MLVETRSNQAAARVQIPVPADVYQRKLADLSAGVALERGHLHVEFSGVEELLGKLYELAQVASNDFDRFRTAVETAAESARSREARSSRMRRCARFWSISTPG